LQIIVFMDGALSAANDAVEDASHAG